MITYIEDKSDKYPPRTFANAFEADATIAIAIDFTTKGEQLTRIAAVKAKKPFHQLSFDELAPLQAEYVANDLQERYGDKEICINIAGNSASLLWQAGLLQIVADRCTYVLIKRLLECGVKIKSIRSGGQSGFDEAGIKAATHHNIPAICHCPKGWPFITAEGKTIRDEQLFKKRFEQ